MKVYKSAGENNDYLVTLKLPRHTPNNLGRSDVTDRNHAKFRCKSARVVAIKHKGTGGSADSIRSTYDENFIYRVGETTTVPNYEENIEYVCSSGIHFYLAEETAFFHGYFPNGEYKEWWDNGVKHLECIHQNGLRHGKCREWLYTGEKWVECTYQNGRLHGEYIAWDRDGEKCSVCTYKNGDPIRTPSPYNLFMQRELPILKRAHPELTHKETFKRVAELWKTAPDNPKNKV